MTLEIRKTVAEDAAPLLEWMSDPKVNLHLPMGEPQEIEDGAKRWCDLYKKGYCLTAVLDGEPVGMGFLFIQDYVVLCHQCMHVLVVRHDCQGQGIGSKLLEELLRVAKDEFKLELVHVEVYGSEEIVDFYKKRGFVEFARQEKWLKIDGSYYNRVLLETYL